jgi:RNA polymerase primary sigma factor
MDQKNFLRQMAELVDFGRTRENVLTKEEIDDYCSDLGLTREQMKLVYAYLTEHQINVPGFQQENAGNVEEEKTTVSQDSKYIRIYRQELRGLPKYTEDELMSLYEKLRSGEEEMISAVVEAHLQRVVTLAGKYKNRGVLLEDLIQEGNLELMTCVSMLCGNREVVDFKKAIDHAVRSRLIELVDTEIADLDSVSSVLARMNLLLEATRALAEEYGRVATIEELAEFTRMDEEEIRMYVDFSQDKIELGKGD